MEPSPKGPRSRPEKPVLFDSHVHTPFCGHAVGRPAAYVWQACRRNLRGLVFTCHNPMPTDFTPSVRMQEEEFPHYLELVHELRETFKGVLEVRLGLECDWLPGFEAFLEEQLSQAPFEFVFGSVHAHFPEYHERFLVENAEQSQRRYFELLAECAETGLFDCLAHPDQIKNVLPAHWNPVVIKDTIGDSLDRIASMGVSMELNTSGLYKAIPEVNPGVAILMLMHERDIPVVLGSDSHQPERIGDEFEFALDLLAGVGYRQICHYTHREREMVDLAAARMSLTTA